MELVSSYLWGPSHSLSFYPPFSFCNDHRSLPMSPPQQSSRGRHGHHLTRDPSLVTALPTHPTPYLGYAPIFHLYFSNPIPVSAGFSTYVGFRVSLYFRIVSFFLHIKPFMSVITDTWEFT